MDGWSGRIDPSITGDARRWHQVVQPAAANGLAGVAMLGFACDEGIRRNGGRVGAAAGPVALRSMLSNLPVLNETPLYDAGNVACTDGDLEGAQLRYAGQMSQLLDAGHLPVGLGGGHEIAFATYQGLAQHLLHGQKAGHPSRVAIINLDAHFDLRKQAQGSSGTPFLQAIEHAAQHGLALEYFCLGVSASANTRQLFNTADAHSVYYRHDDELTLLSLSQQLEQMQSRLDSVDVIYLSICLDVLPAAMAPGVSAPSARGMPMEVIEPLLAAIAATGKVAVVDVAELSPPFDRDNSTARVAARLIHRVTHAIQRANEV
ncbi:formimidoylglutamase [Dyella silvatica]|uniref:formimidoylglutamase n=1 Tax=Dyella silvatica TaxID=2992128 RepID=UPI0022581D20|nr:formimidoylglutamase [Dyella silvatica]